MKNLWFILIVFVLLLSCGNKTGRDVSTSDYEEGWGDNYQRASVDSLTKEESLKNEANKNLSNPTSFHNSSCSSNKHNTSDNMRGFDPASEDDMDDNGMSRYMENNDEEGWN